LWLAFLLLLVFGSEFFGQGFDMGGCDGIASVGSFTKLFAADVYFITFCFYLFLSAFQSLALFK